MSECGEPIRASDGQLGHHSFPNRVRPYYKIMTTINLSKTMRPMADTGHKASRRTARTSRTNH